MRLGAAFLMSAALFTLPLYAQTIQSAHYLEPTDVYGHGAVDGGEYARLRVELSNGTVLDLTYQDAVFEDTAPRLHDFDKDGASEVVTVVSTFDAGARIQIFTLRDGDLVPFASNAPIGTRNRWLAIAGIADFNGDGVSDIAYVDRPHLAKVLRLLSVGAGTRGSKVWELASIPGLSNHHYQAKNIEGGVRQCGEAPAVIVTADADWNNIMETQMDGSVLHSKIVDPYAGSHSFEPFLNCLAK
jgi:hypothetical protein